MKDLMRIKSWLSTVVLPLFCFLVLSACSKSDSSSGQDSVTAIADKVWAFSQTHPDGFTLDLRTMTEPTGKEV